MASFVEFIKSLFHHPEVPGVEVAAASISLTVPDAAITLPPTDGTLNTSTPGNVTVAPVIAAASDSDVEVNSCVFPPPGYLTVRIEPVIAAAPSSNVTVKTDINPTACPQCNATLPTPTPLPLPVAEPPRIPSLETLPICNIDDAVLAALPPLEAGSIGIRRAIIRKKAILGRGKFPGEICLFENAWEATKKAEWEVKHAFDERVIVLFTDSGYRDPIPTNPPESAAGGIVTLLPNGHYDAYSISPKMPHTSGSEDSEIAAITWALNHQGLRIANDRFLRGIYVKEIIAYLDPKFTLTHLDQTRLRPAYCSKNIIELFRVARLIEEEAGIELQFNW